MVARCNNRTRRRLLFSGSSKSRVWKRSGLYEMFFLGTRIFGCRNTARSINTKRRHRKFRDYDSKGLILEFFEGDPACQTQRRKILHKQQALLDILYG